ncbi:MAG: serine/threonine dehydratase [Rhodospirillales bacterium]|nr:serine/threonine dehydratase [Rhodospirillales bacterium]
MTNRHDIASASARIAPMIRRTPVCIVGAKDLDLAFLSHSPLTLKLELLQHTGSFKPRGAFNNLLDPSRPLPPGGHVIAASGGNHGAAVAFAARASGLVAEIFVPATTPEAKRRRIAGFGATLTAIGEDYAAALAASRHRASATGAIEIHAYDDPAVIAGQGTVGCELEEQAPDLTHLLVAAGGGGLLAGIAAWYAGRIAVIGVEPTACPTLHSARAAGHPVPVATGGIAADSLGAREAGQHVFPLIAAHVADLVLVPDDAILAARRLLWDRLRILAEPGGATALAALLSGAFVPPADARVGILVCGGNTGALPE